MNQDDYHHNHHTNSGSHRQAAAGEAAVADNARDVEMGSVDKFPMKDVSPLKDMATEATGSDVGSKEDPQVETSRPSLYKFLLLAKPELPLLLVSFILLILADVANQILPIIIARAYNILVDPSIDSSERSYEINFTMMLVFILTLVGSGMGWMRLCIQGLAGERVVARLRLGLYKSILSQDISFFDETKSGEIVSRLGSDATLLQGSLSQGIPELLSGLTRAIICLVLMFYLSAKLTGMTLGGVFIIFLLSFPLGKLLGKLSKLYQNALGEAQTRSTEALGSM
jgi:ABC-type multidrug transport system fused ATPase/permease subunit